MLNDKQDYYLKKRQKMVETQLKPREISDKKVIESMLTVPRHKFVPESRKDMAYSDSALPIAEGQTISQPYIVALMIQGLNPTEDDSILEIGTGSGYAAAILAQIANKVYTIERHGTLANLAESRFKELGYDNIEVLTGDGTNGWPEKAPFDGILVSAGAPVVPDTLSKQLKTGGKLVIPVGEKRGIQKLFRLEKTPEGDLIQDDLGLVRFVPLVGEKGWKEGE